MGILSEKQLLDSLVLGGYKPHPRGQVVPVALKQMETSDGREPEPFVRLPAYREGSRATAQRSCSMNAGQ